jgi:putative peptidoglycan lipid II flippase
MVNAMVPALSRQKSLQEQKAIIMSMMWRVSIVVLCLCVLVSRYPETLLEYFTSYASTDKHDELALASSLLRVMFWYLLQINIVSMMNALLHVHGKFALPAFMPALINIMLVGAAAGIGLLGWNVVSLAWAVILAGFLQIALVTGLALWRFGGLTWDSVGARAPVGNILGVMATAMAGTGVVQLSSFIDIVIATSLEQKTVSWVYYADRLMQLPLGILGVSMMTVLLPKLSDHHADGNHENYENTFSLGLECILMLSMPVMCVWGILSHEVVATLFGYGKFTLFDVTQTAVCLRWVAMALPAIMLSKMISASSYAKGHVTGLVVASCLAVASNASFALLAKGTLEHQAIAIGIVIGAWVHAIGLFVVSSPLGLAKIWKRCRLNQWVGAWMVTGLLLQAMRHVFTIDCDSAVFHRIFALGVMCLPAGIFYATFLWYMWKHEAGKLFNLSAPT